MKISDLREWATATYGAHSHKEGQFFAALGPIEEWLGHLARHGIALELAPVAGTDFYFESKKLHAKDEPPAGANVGAVGTEADALPPAATFEVPAQTPPQADKDTVAPLPPAEHFTEGDPTVPGYAAGSGDIDPHNPNAGNSANS